MEVTLQQLSKKFVRSWIFKDLNFTIPSGSHCAITGHNGSGKSTLIQIISGARVPSQGSVKYLVNQKEVKLEAAFKQMSFAAPYVELIEELTMKEMFDFHVKFKNMQQGIHFDQFIDLLSYPFKSNQLLRSFSSGMKQRIKIGLALLSDSNLLLLDEPCSNLDQQGREWYQHLITEYGTDRTIIVASNDPFEYEGFDVELGLS